MKGLKAEDLNKCFESIMEFLHKIGFTVLVLLADNAASNRRFYLEKLCLGTWKTHIVNKWNGTNLYLLFDVTHNIKNIYNNFQSKKMFICPEFPPYLNSVTRVCFSDVEELYKSELNKPLKMAYKLNSQILNPKSIEKTSVKLADGLFHESTINGLKYFGKHETAAFLHLIRVLWNIMNVRTPYIGIAKRDSNKDTIHGIDDEKLAIISKFADFLDRWKASLVRIIAIFKVFYSSICFNCSLNKNIHVFIHFIYLSQSL